MKIKVRLLCPELFKTKMSLHVDRKFLKAIVGEKSQSLIQVIHQQI